MEVYMVALSRCSGITFTETLPVLPSLTASSRDPSTASSQTTPCVLFKNKYVLLLLFPIFSFPNRVHRLLCSQWKMFSNRVLCLITFSSWWCWLRKPWDLLRWTHWLTQQSVSGVCWIWTSCTSSSSQLPGCQHNITSISHSSYCSWQPFPLLSLSYLDGTKLLQTGPGCTWTCNFSIVEPKTGGLPGLSGCQPSGLTLHIQTTWKNTTSIVLVLNKLYMVGIEVYKVNKAIEKER